MKKTLLTPTHHTWPHHCARYLETTPERPSEHEGETDSALGHMNTVHSEAELYAMIGQEDG